MFAFFRVKDLARNLLEKHSKDGTVPVVVEQHADGRNAGVRGRMRKDGGSSRAIVPSKTLLATPAAIWQDSPELQRAMSLPTFRSIIHRAFGEYRQGQRETDVCSHCQCYWNDLIPRFEQDWAKIQQDLRQTMPTYLDDFPEAEEFQDVAAKAAAAHAYIAGHAGRYHAERVASGCDRMHLWSFVEAPAQHLLKGHSRLLKCYSWHLVSGRRQQETLKALMLPGGLAKEDTLLVFDWREKIRVPIGPYETGDLLLWVLCFQACTWAQGSGRSSRSPRADIFVLPHRREGTNCRE